MLSRIETNKQGLDFDVFLTLARILETSPNDFLDQQSEPAAEPIAKKLATLHTDEKVKFWRGLSAANRARRDARGGLRSAATEQQLEELLAQVEYLREEIDALRRNSRRR